MTPEEIKTLGHAFFDGKTLQYNGVKDFWDDWTSSHCPSFREGFKWRIKPDEPKKVKLEAWINKNGFLMHKANFGESSVSVSWVRIPELDREITLPEEE